MLETVLKTGRDSGFSTVEAFAEKTWRQESEGIGPSLSLHEVQGDRLLVRAFRDVGDPLGFSLSAPDARQVRRCFAELASGSVLDRKKNFAHWLPKSVQKIKLNIYDPGIELGEGTQAADLREKVLECLVTFPGMKLKKFQFARVLKKVYLANSRGFLAKYKKTLFQARVSFMLADHVLELSECRVHFRNIDPQRLVARGANLLGSLAAGGTPAGDDLLVMSPEASAQILKEFSHHLKLERAGARGRGAAASPRLSILDNPALDEQSGSVPFDDEGTTAKERYLINKGVAVAAAADIRTAFEIGGSSTGNGFRDERGTFPQVQFSNLYIKPSNSSLAQILRRAGQGVLVYLVKRQGAGRQPGEHVFSATGYAFTAGEIARPVRFDFTTSMRSYLLHILETSRELRFFQSRANFGSPYLLLQGRRDGEKNIFI